MSHFSPIEQLLGQFSPFLQLFPPLNTLIYDKNYENCYESLINIWLCFKMRHLKLCWIPPPLKFMSQLIFFSKLGFAGTPPPVFETMSQNMQFFFWPASLS